MLRWTLLIALTFITGCSNPESYNNTSWTEICGRDNGISLTRESIYRIKAPNDWTRKDPSPDESIVDSKKSLCEFNIPGGIRIAIHNFPSERQDDRVPPGAQITRWKRQFDQLDPTSLSIVPQSFGGFSGFLFEGSGLMNGERITMMGWAMQIAPEHYRHLHSNQMRGDYTIKATGPAVAMREHHQAIIAFARTFELIQEIPSQP